MSVATRQFLLSTSAICFLLLPTQVLAQAAAQSDTSPAATPEYSPADESAAEQRESKDEIIVTGTLLRGISPPGAQTLSIGREEAIATGATSTKQLLANTPQISDFGARPSYQGSFNTQFTVNHPELRNLGAALPGGGSATLLLMDGHRLSGMGIRQTIPDADVIPPGAIERVEIVPDGGSATYGADAVGGVINYITRRRFNGLEADARYGFTSDYKSVDANVTAGKDWDAGSVWITYNYSWHDSLYGRDRDYIRRFDYFNNRLIDTQCYPGNVRFTGVANLYALPDLTPSLNGNRCDAAGLAGGSDNTVYPEERRHSVLASLTQDLDDRISVDVKAFYTHRANIADTGPLLATLTVLPTNPFYRSTGDANAGRIQSVDLNFHPVFGRSTPQYDTLSAHGVAISPKVKLGGDWELKGLFNYGRAANTANLFGYNGALLNTLVATGAINPYDPLAPGNAAALAPVGDSKTYSRGRNELFQYRAIADGTLFELPGGGVKLAAGGEYLVEDYRIESATGPRNTALAPTSQGRAHRNTKAAFFEVFVPVFGEDNRTGGFYSLSLSASGRYDDYSDFGGTFNPRFAATWEPTDWIKLRGNWGKSFQAPSLADTQTASTSAVTVLTQPLFISLFGNPAVPPASPARTNIVFLTGGGVNLRPQKATTWSIGADIKPPIVPGLLLSASYYKIDFKGIIASAPVTSGPSFFANYPGFYTLNPTAAQVQEFVSPAADGQNQINLTGGEGAVYLLLDSRRANFSNSKTSGLDFSANYRTATGFGAIFANASGNYVLTRKDQGGPGQPFLNNVHLSSRFRLSATVGATIGDFLGQATLQHKGGFRVPAAAANNFQTHVGRFDVVNLFFKYDIQSSSFLKDTSLTLNVDNVFDQDPPLYQGVFVGGGGAGGLGGGYANGFTLGRVVQFGIRKKFF